MREARITPIAAAVAAIMLFTKLRRLLASIAVSLACYTYAMTSISTMALSPGSATAWIVVRTGGTSPKRPL